MYIRSGGPTWIFSGSCFTFALGEGVELFRASAEVIDIIFEAFQLGIGSKIMQPLEPKEDRNNFEEKAGDILKF